MDKNESKNIENNDPKDGHQSNDVQDLVDQIFQTITNNNQIPKTVKDELAKLHPSYLQIALDTPNLFRLENHQARLFLEAITTLTAEQHSLGLITELFIKKIKILVEQINKLEQYDSKLFVKLQSDLERLIKRQVKRTEIKKKRENEKQKGLEKINQAKKSAKQLLHERIAHKKLPRFVNNILIEDWFNVLVLFNLRYNPQSKEYQENLTFIDLLVEYSHAGSLSTVSKSQILTLSKKYKKGLEMVAFNSTDCEVKSKELLIKMNQLIQSRVSKMKEDKAREETKKGTKQSIKENLVKPEDIIKISAFQKQQDNNSTKNIQKKKTKPIEIKKENKINYSEMIDSLKKGDWFEIFTEKNTVIKAKLSWISPISGKYLFVDLNGLKISDKTKIELQECLQNKTIKIINTTTK